MKQAVVDRFEGTITVLLIEGVPFNILRSKLPKGTKEGDYLQVELHGMEVMTVERDDAATEAARKRIADKLDRLRRGDHLSSDDNG